MIFIIYPKFSERHVWKNSVDPDNMPQNAESVQVLHCLSLIQQCLATWTGSKMDKLTFTILRANSAHNKLMIFFPENRIWHFMQIVSNGDNLHEMSNSVLWEK